jgi:outer membrane protein TolC
VTTEQTALSGSVGVRRLFAFGLDVSLGVETLADLEARAIPTLAQLQEPIQLGPTYDFALSLEAAMPLLRGLGATVGEAELRARMAERTAAERARDRVASEALHDALSAYWELWYATEALAIDRAALELAGEQLAQGRARVDLGALAPAETLQLATRVATLEEQVVQSEAEVRRRSIALARLLGGDGPAGSGTAIDAAGLMPAPDPPEVPPAPPEDAAQLVREASPSVGESEAAIEAARVRAETAGEGLRPRLDLTASLRAQGLGNDDAAAALEQLGTFSAVSAMVGLSLELPLDPTRRRAEQAAATTGVRAAEERRTERVEAALMELRTAVVQDEAARRRLQLAERTIAIAEEQVVADAARFATGSATALQVAEAEDQLRSARLRRTRARVDLTQAGLTVAHLTGRLVEQAPR